MSQKKVKQYKRIARMTMSKQAQKYKFEGMRDVMRAYTQMTFWQRLKLCYGILFKLKKES